MGLLGLPRISTTMGACSKISSKHVYRLADERQLKLPVGRNN